MRVDLTRGFDSLLEWIAGNTNRRRPLSPASYEASLERSSSRRRSNLDDNAYGQRGSHLSSSASSARASNTRQDYAYDWQGSGSSSAEAYGPRNSFAFHNENRSAVARVEKIYQQTFEAENVQHLAAVKNLYDSVWDGVRRTNQSNPDLDHPACLNSGTALPGDFNLLDHDKFSYRGLLVLPRLAPSHQFYSESVVQIIPDFTLLERAANERRVYMCMGFDRESLSKLIDVTDAFYIWRAFMRNFQDDPTAVRKQYESRLLADGKSKTDWADYVLKDLLTANVRLFPPLDNFAELIRLFTAHDTVELELRYRLGATRPVVQQRPQAKSEKSGEQTTLLNSKEKAKKRASRRHRIKLVGVNRIKELELQVEDLKKQLREAKNKSRSRSRSSTRSGTRSKSRSRSHTRSRSKSVSEKNTDTKPVSRPPSPNREVENVVPLEQLLEVVQTDKVYDSSL